MRKRKNPVRGTDALRLPCASLLLFGWRRRRQHWNQYRPATTPAAQKCAPACAAHEEQPEQAAHIYAPHAVLASPYPGDRRCGSNNAPLQDGSALQQTASPTPPPPSAAWHWLCRGPAL